MEFEWDEAKAESNLSKHGVAFEDATAVFGGRLRFEQADTSGDYRQERLITIGLAQQGELTLVRTQRRLKTRLIFARRRQRMSEDSTGRIVRYTYDPLAPPRMSDEAKARFDAIREEDIDLSDIPEQSGLAGWNRPGLSGGPAGAFRRAALEKRYLLVEPEVVAFFKASGEKAEERMNAVLREYVEMHRKSA